MKIFDGGIYHDTENTNLNFVDLREPFEQYAKPIFPRLDFSKIPDPVRFFRKVILFQWYPGVLGYVIIDGRGEPRLKTKKEKKSKPSENMGKKVRFLLDRYASKETVAQAMTNVGGGKPAMEFFDNVYQEVKRRIKNDIV